MTIIAPVLQSALEAVRPSALIRRRRRRYPPSMEAPDVDPAD